MNAEYISYLVVIAGFVIGAVVNSVVWVYTYGRLQGRLEEREKHLDTKFTNLQSAFESHENTFKNPDGEPRYLTRLAHREECSEHSKLFLAETNNIKSSLSELRKSVTSIQDSMLSFATSGKFRGQKDDRD